MNLYMIPTHSHSTPEDVRRYSARHDLGPHPDLRLLDGQPVAVRMAELERQILLFEERFKVKALTSRNHCTAWAGYLEPIEVMERLGVRMDADYLSGTYLRDRACAPYAPFGAAMPMRFCRPDGRLLDVYQQHSHFSDDVMFHATVDYSYKFEPAQFDAMAARIFTDIATRFHTPFAVVIHPDNWMAFSRPQGQSLLRRAAERGLPVWSFDQWCRFWDLRDQWRFEEVAWSGTTLTFRAKGAAAQRDLRVQLPTSWSGLTLGAVHVDGAPVQWQAVSCFGEPAALAPLAERAECEVRAIYR